MYEPENKYFGIIVPLSKDSKLFKTKRLRLLIETFLLYQEQSRHNLRGHSIAVSPFSKLILRENQNLFQKGSLKRSNYWIAEAEAIMSDTGQIQLEMVPIRRT